MRREILGNSTVIAEQNTSEEIEPPPITRYPSLDKAVTALRPVTYGNIYISENRYDHSVSICISTKGKGGYEAARFYHREGMLLCNEDFMIKQGFTHQYQEIIQFFRERGFDNFYTPRKTQEETESSKIISIFSYFSRDRKEKLIKYKGESYNDVLDRKFQESLEENRKLEESMPGLEEQVNEVIRASESKRLVS